ncbi:hypothetical protein RUM44_011819 [Polyplax serrata]|uniref:Protein Wnt n=1 Tax=Polyplax serrata TaxID=468196 RepID=A0ABR1AR25_POLSC
MCRTSPDAMIAVGEGVRMGTAECQQQFKYQRWNCSALGSSQVFGHVIIVGSREAAFTYAIFSAGVTYSVTAACSRGNISSCGCESTRYSTSEIAHRGWKWGGCSSDVGFGMQFARKFLDAREIEGDARSLMNLHNNKAGRKAVKVSLLIDCKCHGVSGSCTMKTCWKILPPFRQIGDNLMKKYSKARIVVAIQSGMDIESTETRTKFLKLVLIRAKAQGQANNIPKRSDLVYLQNSPNYCERDLIAGSLGTIGRFCNRTSKETNGCDLLCCGRGYNTHQYIKSWQCRCKFHWCCYVNCDTCTQKTEEYTCK